MNVAPTSEHEFFDVARAQGVGDIRADVHETDIVRETGALEVDHPYSPSPVQSGF